MNYLKSSEFPPIIRRRYRAALDLRESSIEAVAQQAGVTTRHLQFCLNGQRRPGPRLAAQLRAAVGETGFAFAVGEVDTLTDAAPAREAQPCR